MTHKGLTAAEVEAKAKRVAIESELAELDRIIPRKDEDLYRDLGVEPGYAPRAAAMKRKAELRTELAALA